MGQLDRSWALGLEQHVFATEFAKRHPFAHGLCPAVDTYVQSVSKPEKRGIDGVKDEGLVDNDDVKRYVEKKKNNEKAVPKTSLVCIGCGFKAKANIGRISHEKRCPDALKKKSRG